MEIVVRGRNCEVTDRFRRHAEEKLVKLERLDGQIIRADVEVTEERNPRLSGESERVEITMISRGPVIRAEAATADRYSALDVATSKVETRLRRANSRRHDYRKGAQSGRLASVASVPLVAPTIEAAPTSADPLDQHGEWDEVTRAGGVVVREKSHQAVPMSLDQALYEMELVGHDFFLFVDEELKLPSVVYRRKGYDYGVIRLTD